MFYCSGILIPIVKTITASISNKSKKVNKENGINN